MLLDYYVEAEDNKGNVSRSMILHVWVGDGNSTIGGGGGDDDVVSTVGSYKISPVEPTVDDVITITAPNGRDGIILHWGVNNYEKPVEAYLPEGSQYHSDGKAARTPFYRNANNELEVKIGPFNNPEQAASYISFVTNTGNDWDNNGNQNYRIALKATSGVSTVAGDNAAAPVEYYNLQGIRIAEPLPAGIYVRRQGTSVSKIVVR